MLTLGDTVYSHKFGKGIVVKDSYKCTILLEDHLPFVRIACDKYGIVHKSGMPDPTIDFVKIVPNMFQELMDVEYENLLNEGSEKPYKVPLFTRCLDCGASWRTFKDSDEICPSCNSTNIFNLNTRKKDEVY